MKVRKLSLMIAAGLGAAMLALGPAARAQPTMLKLKDAAQMAFVEDNESSRAAEFHPRALPEPYVSLSTHTAPSIRAFA